MNPTTQQAGPPNLLAQLAALTKSISREYEIDAASDLVNDAIRDNYYIEAICLAEQYLLEAGLSFLGIPRGIPKHSIQMIGMADVLLHNHIITGPEKEFIEKLCHSRNDWAHRSLRKGRILQKELTDVINPTIRLADLILLRGYQYLVTRDMINERPGLLSMIILNFARKYPPKKLAEAGSTDRLLQIIVTIGKVAAGLEKREPEQFKLYAKQSKAK